MSCFPPVLLKGLEAGQALLFEQQTDRKHSFLKDAMVGNSTHDVPILQVLAVGGL